MAGSFCWTRNKGRPTISPLGMLPCAPLPRPASPHLIVSGCCARVSAKDVSVQENSLAALGGALSQRHALRLCLRCPWRFHQPTWALPPPRNPAFASRTFSSFPFWGVATLAKSSWLSGPQTAKYTLFTAALQQPLPPSPPAQRLLVLFHEGCGLCFFATGGCAESPEEAPCG